MTIEVEMDNGRVYVFENVTHFWNPSIRRSVMNGMDMLSHGTIQIDYEHKEKQATIPAQKIHSFHDEDGRMSPSKHSLSMNTDSM